MMNNRDAVHSASTALTITKNHYTMNHYPANYHTHSLYCDGKSTLEEHVREAEKQGLRQLGFSSHSPVPFENSFAISEEKVPEYVREIDELQQKTSIKLLKSLEVG